MKRFKVGLALGSGSARGLAHIGVLKIFEKENIPIDFIAGTSIGALIGGAYAAGINACKLEEIACSIDIKKMVTLADITIPSTALVNGKKVEDFIQELVGKKDFSELNIPFACVAVDILTGEEVVFKEGNVVKAIRASISMPILFTPVREGNRLLVDGGITNPVPVDVVKDMGADITIAVHLIPEFSEKFASLYQREEEIKEMKKAGFPKFFYSKVLGKVREKTPNLTIYQLASRSIDLMQKELAQPKLEHADFLVSPEISNVSVYSFHEAEKIIKLGEKAAQDKILEIKTVLKGE